MSTQKMSKLRVDKMHRQIIKDIKFSQNQKDIENFFSPLWGKIILQVRSSYVSESSALSYKEVIGFAAAEAASIRALCLKKYHNFYVYDKSVVDFIKNARLNDNDIKQMHEIALQFVEDHKQYGFVVHMAGEDQSILFTFSPVDKLQHISMERGRIINGFSMFHKRFCVGEQADIGFIPVSEEDGIIGGNIVNDNETGTGIWRIFFNLCMYMSAFPECVIDGAPPIKINGSRDRSTTVKASKAIKDVYRDGVSPHMRRGHFRFLKSERYTTKRNQAIYVKPTMVKGRASTVVEV